MPNLMVGFLNDITHTSKTASDITDIVRTSVEIQNTVMGGVKTVKSTVKRLKSGETLRSVTNWFKQQETFGESSSFAAEDDDFDAGFGTEIDDDTTSSALSADDMKDIGVGQTREMYRIANKTYEAEVHTTAEILNTIEQRSSEILAGLHTTQTHLQHMTKTLDKIIGIQESKLAQQDRRTSVFDENGNLTLQSVFGSMMNQFTSSRRSLLKSVMDKTGLTALDEMSHEAITNMSNTVFSKLLLNPKFKKIFGDQTQMHGPSNYSAYVEDSYNTKPAIFDGRVRKTIVDIIPGYLKAITHAVTGKVYHVSDYGTLTTEKPADQFDMSIDVTFHTNLNQKYATSISSDSGNDDATIDTISKLQSILVSQYIFYAYKNGITVFDADDLSHGGIKSIHKHVAILFSNQTHSHYSYWIKMLSYIESRMMTDGQYRQSFARSINAGFQALDAAAKKAVNSGNVTTTQFTRDMFDRHANDLINYDNAFAAFEGKTPRQLINEGLITEAELPDKYLKNMDQKIDSLEDFHKELHKSAYDTEGNLLNEILRTKHMYLAGIFERLNIGINVFVVPWNYREEVVPEINTRAMDVLYPTSTDPIVIDLGIPRDEYDAQPDGSITRKPGKLEAGARKVGDAIKRNGVVNSIRNTISTEWNKTKDDFNMFKDQAIDAFGNKVDEAYLLNDVERLSKSDNEQDNKDVTTIKAVMSGLQTAAGDGDVQEDLGELKKLASEIEDPEAKKRVNAIVQNTLERSAKKSKPKSILGKAVLFIFGAFKTVVNKVKSTVGKMLGKYLKWVTKMFKSAAKNIVTGAKSFKEGLLGNKDGTQKGLIRDTIAWGKQKASNIWNSRLVTGVRNVSGHVANSLKTLGGKAIDKAKNVGAAISDKAKPILGALGDFAKNAASKVGSTALAVKDAASDKFDKLKDKFANTSFGKGFMSAFEDEKPEITSTSLFDKRAADINDIVQDSPTGTFFATLVSSVKEYSEALTDYFDLMSDEEESEEEARKRIQEQQKKRAEEEQKKKEEAERKKKEEEERKKKEAEEAAKQKASAKSPIGFDLGKMVGGFAKILQGILKSVGTIIKSMTGLMAILEIGDQILKKSLKPLNKVFFQIYKLLKPIVKLVTQILKEVVNAVVRIVKSLVDVLQPIFDALEPIISSILESLMPILDMVTQVLDIILIPMTAMLKVTVIPILRGISNGLQMLTGILQVGLGIILTALSGWLIATGMILKWLTHSDSLLETGKQLFTTGTSMVQSGAKSYISGIKGQIALLKDQATNILTLGTKNAGLDDDEDGDTKTSKRKATPLHGSALEGTYGSGDYDTDALYEFDAPIQEAMKELSGTGKKFIDFFMPEDENDDITNGGIKELQKLTQRIVGVFTGEEDDTVSERLEKESNKQTEDQVLYSASDLTDEEKQAIEEIAFQNFQADHQPKPTETVDEYRKRYEKSYKQKYVNAATAKYLKEKQEKTLAGEDDGPMSIINSTSGEDGMISKFSSGMESVDSSVQSGQFGDVISDYVSSLGDDSDSEEDGTTTKRRKRKGGKDRVLRAASEVFLAAKKAQQRDNGPYGHGAYLKNIEFDDGQVIDMMSAMCTGTQAAIIKRMGYYLPAANGRSYSSTYQGDYAMGWANGTPSGWGVNNSDGHPNIYDKNGKKSTDWIVTNDGSYQAGDITLPGTAWGDYSQTMWHAHMAAFQYGGRWYGFNGGDPKNNPESIKGQNIAEFYLSHGRMPQDGDDIDISKYNSSGYRQDYGGKIGVVIRYVGGSDDEDEYYDDEDYETTSSSRGKKLKGGSMEEKVYKYLTSKGMSGIGAAGMMGCFKYESNFQPNNLEDSYQTKWGYPAGEAGDKKYTADVDSKRESERQFVTSRGTGTSGYGIPQFTSSNLKQDLYNRTVKRGVSISDTASQLDAILSHIKKNAKVKGVTLFDKIKHASSPTEANKWFLWRYEAGVAYNSDAAVASDYPWMGMQGINNRHSAAEQYYDMYGGGMDDDAEGVAYVDNDDYDMSYIESMKDQLMSQTDQQDYIFDDLEEADIELPTGDVYIPTLEPPTIQQSIPKLEIPTPSFTTQSHPIVINQFDSEFDLTKYVDDVLKNEYDIESSRIKELVDGIFEELPEYLEDDDDDFTEEDDLFIQQLASAFI